MKKRIIVASANKGKIREISEMLVGYEVVGYKQLGLNFDIAETGSTFYENALIKAKAVAEATGEAVLADDSGLVVEALGGAPGIYSARYSRGGSDGDNMDLLLKNLSGKDNRRAKFVCCTVLYFPDGRIFRAEGETEGRIEKEKFGSKGFGYDPVFYSFDLNKCFGEATEEEKNSVSHRFRAIEKMKKILSEQGF